MLDMQQDNHPTLHMHVLLPQVKLGFVKLVASITSQCVRQDRPDSVAKASTPLRSCVPQQLLGSLPMLTVGLGISQ
jgi:hypothetical protein